MPEANSEGMILTKDEENDAEVRREDQDKINEFGQLNARLHEVRAQCKKLKVRATAAAALLFLLTSRSAILITCHCQLY
jgi:hypothetical protein